MIGYPKVGDGGLTWTTYVSMVSFIDKKGYTPLHGDKRGYSGARAPRGPDGMSSARSTQQCFSLYPTRTKKHQQRWSWCLQKWPFTGDGKIPLLSTSGVATTLLSVFVLPHSVHFSNSMLSRTEHPCAAKYAHLSKDLDSNFRRHKPCAVFEGTDF